MRLQAKLDQVEAAMAHPGAQKDEETLKTVATHFIHRNEWDATANVTALMRALPYAYAFPNFCRQQVTEFLKEKDYAAAMACIALQDEGQHWLKYDVAAARAANGELSRAEQWAEAQSRTLDRACACLGVAHGLMQTAGMIPP